MAGPVAQGGTITLDATFRRGSTGELVDPPDVTVDILDPAELELVHAAAGVRVSTGIYAYPYLVDLAAELGTWAARWHGTVDGVLLEGFDYFDVVPFGTVEPAVTVYGADLADVQAFIPDQAIIVNSKPTAAQVENLLAQVDARVSGRVGDVTGYPVDQQAQVLLEGKSLVAMGAAALAWNAAHPEAAGRGASTYGDWLWAQMTAGVDELLESLNKPTTDAGAGGVAPTDRPAYNLPEPMFWRDTAF